MPTELPVAPLAQNPQEQDSICQRFRDIEVRYTAKIEQMSEELRNSQWREWGWLAGALQIKKILLAAPLLSTDVVESLLISGQVA